MSSFSKCEFCTEYEDQGHNFCRKCGFHIRKGYANNARIAIAYNSSEKFCGYCGGPKNNCECCK